MVDLRTDVAGARWIVSQRVAERQAQGWKLAGRTVRGLVLMTRPAPAPPAADPEPPAAPPATAAEAPAPAKKAPAKKKPAAKKKAPARRRVPRRKKKEA
jgi:hypothetical protein